MPRGQAKVEGGGGSPPSPTRGPEESKKKGVPSGSGKLGKVPPRPRRPYFTLAQFRQVERAMLHDGYGEMFAEIEALKPPRDCTTFAKACCYVIVNSGMRVTVANRIYWKCVRALRVGKSATSVFGHPGKAAAIDHIWRYRRVLHDGYRIAQNKLAYLEALPFIGPVTKYHLFRNLGGDVAKPDVHMFRLAKSEGSTARKLCERLARQTGYRIGTVDTVLWAACAYGYIKSSEYGSEPWEAVFNPRPPWR